MERLTIDEIIEHCGRKTGMYEKACDVKQLETAVMGNGIKEYWEHKQVAEYLRKLKEYEDLEEQGRLIKLPCKVGDTVWKVEERLEHTYIERLVIDRIEVNDNYIYYFANEKITGESVILDNCDFSKTVFLTKSEAEAKLKELRGGNE